MNVYDAPQHPQEAYTQGFWYAVMAAILYLVCSMILMINMLGYFLGHYGQHFNLSEAQRTLILQTMVFFLWLAGGAGVFARVESDIGKQDWVFTDGLYFCKSFIHHCLLYNIIFKRNFDKSELGKALVKNNRSKIID